MYWLCVCFVTGAALIAYAPEAPSGWDAVDGYDREQDAVAALNAWRRQR